MSKYQKCFLHNTNNTPMTLDTHKNKKKNTEISEWKVDNVVFSILMLE